MVLLRLHPRLQPLLLQLPDAPQQQRGVPVRPGVSFSPLKFLDSDFWFLIGGFGGTPPIAKMEQMTTIRSPLLSLDKALITLAKELKLQVIEG